MTDGRLYAQLPEVEDAANTLPNRMIPEMAKEAGAAGKLKARDPMRWMGPINCRKVSIVSAQIKHEWQPK